MRRNDFLSTAAVWCVPFCLDCSVPSVYSINFKRKKKKRTLCIAIDPHQTSPRVRRVAVDPPLTMWVLSFDFPDNPAYSFTHHPYSVSSIGGIFNLKNKTAFPAAEK